jgi:hypothetical protein
MAKRIPQHIRTKVAVSDAILRLAFDLANDTFDQKWSGAGTTLLTASLSYLSSEAVYMDRQLETAEYSSKQDKDLNAILKALSKHQKGRSFLKEQAKIINHADLAARLKKLSKGHRRGKNLLDLTILRSISGSHVPVIGVAVAMLAMVHSAFNTDNVSSDTGVTAYTTLRDLRNEMELALYTACLQGTDPIKIAGMVTSYASNLLYWVVELTRAVRDSKAQIAALHEQGSGGAAEVLESEIVKWSHEIREAVSSLTSASALCLGGFTKRHAFLTDPDQVGQQAFAFNIPDGKNTEIDDLQDGKLADIAGRVTAVNVKRKAKHLITTIDLTDPSSGASTTAALSFVNGHNLGITVGASLICTGVLHTKSTLNQDKPAFHVSQLPLASLSETSWRAGFLHLGSTFMETWPNGHLMHWTMGPHTTTAFEQPGTGAGEVLLRLTPNIIGKW